MTAFKRQSVKMDSASGGKPFSSAVRAGDLLFISGHSGVQGESPNGDIHIQARAAFEEIRKAVTAAGGTMADVVDLLAAFVDIRDVDDTLEVAREFFPDNYPAWTAMGTQGLQHRGARLVIHAVAHLGPEKKQCFTPDSLRWWRKYPISGACRKGPYLFISGQMPVDMDGNVVNPGDHGAQSRYLFGRMKELAELAGGKLEDDLLDILSFSIDPRSFAPMCAVKNAEFLIMPFARLRVRRSSAQPACISIWRFTPCAVFVRLATARQSRTRPPVSSGATFRFPEEQRKKKASFFAWRAKSAWIWMDKLSLPATRSGRPGTPSTASAK